MVEEITNLILEKKKEIPNLNLSLKELVEITYKLEGLTMEEMKSEREREREREHCVNDFISYKYLPLFFI